MNEAELHSAFFFTCDACGRDSFLPAREASLSEEAAERIAAGQASVHYDTIADVVDSDEVVEQAEGETAFVISRVAIAPSTVTCEHCGEQYASVLAYDSEA